MHPIKQYIQSRNDQVTSTISDVCLQNAVINFTEKLVKINYIKNFTYLGVPILQYPNDLMVMQELIWEIQPDIIIEVGIGFGGMLIFYASILELIYEFGEKGRVIGIDIDIRKSNRETIEAHQLNHRIHLVEGNSVNKETFLEVKETIKNYSIDCRIDRGDDCMNPPKILISLDSNHTENHVLEELKLYSQLVSQDSYLVVFDTAIEFYGHLDKNQDRPWGKGNNPYTAVQQFLKNNDEFAIDAEVEQRALITSAPGGWLRRIRPF